MLLNINGNNHEVDVEENMPLLWVLRDVLLMTGTKYGCGVAACGACSINIDGIVMRSCTLPASAAVGSKITTIEGIGKEGELSEIQKSWIKHQVPQCGYCQSGMIIAAEQLLEGIPDPSDEDIDVAMSNICRCGTYERVRKAIKSVAKLKISKNS